LAEHHVKGDFDVLEGFLTFKGQANLLIFFRHNDGEDNVQDMGPVHTLQGPRPDQAVGPKRAH
jgi:hypothetical protein